jgi:hypothetical protein
VNVKARLIKWYLVRQIKKQLKRRGVSRKERKQMMTNGMKTSEFWMSVVAILLKWLGPHLGMDFPNEAVGSVAAYVVGRSLRKFGTVSK